MADQYQWGWRFCSKCSTIFWHEHINAGVCAKGGGHDAHGFEFVLDYNQFDLPRIVSGFSYCNKCHSLFHQKDYYPDHGSASTLGICPKGDRHDPTSSFEYVLHLNGPQRPGQDKWRVCKRCNCLNYTPAHGKCAGETDGGGVIGHIPYENEEFTLEFDTNWVE